MISDTAQVREHNGNVSKTNIHNIVQLFDGNKWNGMGFVWETKKNDLRQVLTQNTWILYI